MFLLRVIKRDNMKKVLIKIEEGLTLKIKFPNGETIEYSDMVDWDTEDMLGTIMDLGIKCNYEGWLVEFNNVL